MGGLCLSVKLHREGSAPTACAAGLFMFILFPSKEQEKCQILDHMISTLHMLMTKYPDCGWVAGGDKNQFPLAPLLAAFPNSRQLVTQISDKKSGKIYDVLITNMGQFYQIPYTCPLVQVDEPSSGAVPSDHDCAVAEQLAGAGGGSTRA